MSMQVITATLKTKKFLFAAATAAFVAALVVIQKTVETDVEFDEIAFESDEN